MIIGGRRLNTSLTTTELLIATLYSIGRTPAYISSKLALPYQLVLQTIQSETVQTYLQEQDKANRNKLIALQHDALDTLHDLLFSASENIRLRTALGILNAKLVPLTGREDAGRDKDAYKALLQQVNFYLNSNSSPERTTAERSVVTRITNDDTRIANDVVTEQLHEEETEV